MAQITNSRFQVADGQGAAYRPFTFDTTSQGSEYAVTITYDGSGPLTSVLSKSGPTRVTLPASTARVYPSGDLILSWDSSTSDSTVLILFTGTLNTANSVTMTNVCVGAID